jgi:hypothetical protein
VALSCGERNTNLQATDYRESGASSGRRQEERGCLTQTNEQFRLVLVAVDEVDESQVKKVLENAGNRFQPSNFPLCWRFFTR